jgi:hypothetical protein
VNESGESEVQAHSAANEEETPGCVIQFNNAIPEDDDVVPHSATEAEQIPASNATPEDQQ